MKNIIIFVIVAGLVVGGYVIISGKIQLSSGSTETSTTTASKQTPTNQQAETESEVETNVESLIQKGLGNIQSSFYYEVTASAPTVENQKIKLWKKGEEYRYEVTAKAQEVVGIGDKSKKKFYLYMPAQNIAMEVDTSEQKDSKSKKRESPGKLLEKALDNKPTISGEEMVNGRNCKIVEFTENEDDYKLWVGTEKGMIWKYEVTTEQGVFEITIDKIEFKEISDDKFELPEGVQVQQTPSIPTQ